MLNTRTLAKLLIDLKYIRVLICSSVSTSGSTHPCCILSGLKARHVNVGRIETDPRRCKHEINMSLISEPPVLEDLFKIELTDNFMSSEHCVHISFETQISVYTSLVKLNLHEAVRIRPNNEVHLCPINHYNLLDVVDDIR